MTVLIALAFCVGGIAGYFVGFADRAASQAGPAAQLLAACRECEHAADGKERWKCPAKRAIFGEEKPHGR